MKTLKLNELRRRQQAIDGAIKFARENWLNDGAEGETVHLLAWAAECIPELLEMFDLVDHLLERERREHEETKGYRQHAEQMLDAVTLSSESTPEFIEKERQRLQDEKSESVEAGARAAMAGLRDVLENGYQGQFNDTEQHALAQAIEVLRTELAEARNGYHALDKNWERHHEACLQPIREALYLPDGSVPELFAKIEELRKKNAAYLAAIENASPTDSDGFDCIAYDECNNAHATYGGPIISRGALRMQKHEGDDYPSVSQVVFDQDTLSFEVEHVGYLLTDEDVCDLTGDDEGDGP